MASQTSSEIRAEPSELCSETKEMIVEVIAALCCPSCSGDLKKDGGNVTCPDHAAIYEISDGIINFVGQRNLVDEQEIVEINELVKELRERNESQRGILDATSLPNRRNTEARYQSEIKSLKRPKQAYGHAFSGGRVLDYSCGAVVRR